MKKIIFVLLLEIMLGGCAREADQTIRGMSEVTADTAETTGREPGGAEEAVAAGRDQSDTNEGSAAGSSIRQTEIEADTDTEQLAVFICGAVENPGVYYFDPGTRVCDALEAAGGLCDTADPEWLNQADFLRDGQKLKVYTGEETAQMQVSGQTEGSGTAESAASGQAEGSGTAESAASGQTERSGMAESAGTGSEESRSGVSGTDARVNLNTAGKAELMTLTGIGESRADAVIRYRSEHGGFQSIEEIKNISGIKEAVFCKIKDQITV